MRTWSDISELGLSTGKKARLHRILYQHGLRNGTALFLPYDQGLEHGPRDFFANPAAGDPAYIARLGMPLIVWAYPRGAVGRADHAAGLRWRAGRR